MPVCSWWATRLSRSCGLKVLECAFQVARDLAAAHHPIVCIVGITGVGGLRTDFRPGEAKLKMAASGRCASPKATRRDGKELFYIADDFTLMVSRYHNSKVLNGAER